MPIHNVNKPLGWTPLQALEALRSHHPELKDVPMTYAGRLDPMADGLLLILSGEERYDLKEYLKVDKVYEAEVVFGISTDTHDALGLSTSAAPSCTPSQAQKAIADLKGTHEIPFPAYSAYKVKGKPLHWWAQMDRLHEIDIPIKSMTVRDVSDIHTDQVEASDLLDDIQERIKHVTGVFRQEIITGSWNRTLLSNTPPLTRGRFLCTVSSGTYIRSLAHLMGQQVGTGAFLLSLKRHSVGDYQLHDAEDVSTPSDTDPSQR